MDRKPTRRSRLVPILLITVLAALGSTALANRAPIPQPPPEPAPAPVQTKGVDLDVKVVTKSGAKPGDPIVLEISSDILKRIAGSTADGKRADAGAASDTAGRTQTGTVIAGIAISLALVLGGVTFFRQRHDGQPGHKGLMILAIGAAVAIGGVAMTVNANLAPPPDPRPSPKPIVIKKPQADHSVKMKIIVAKKQGSPRIHVSEAQLKALQATIAQQQKTTKKR